MKKPITNLRVEATPGLGELNEELALGLLLRFGEYLSDEVQSLLASIVGLELSRSDSPGRYRPVVGDSESVDDEYVGDDWVVEDRFEAVGDMQNRRIAYVVDKLDVNRVAARSGVKTPDEWDDCNIVIERLVTWRLIEAELAETVAGGVYTAAESLLHVRKLIRAYARAARRCVGGKINKALHER